MINVEAHAAHCRRASAVVVLINLNWGGFANVCAMDWGRVVAVLNYCGVGGEDQIILVESTGKFKRRAE